MRVVIVSKDGLRFYGNNVEETSEQYCSCSKPKSVRNITSSGDSVLISVPNSEYAAVVLRRTGTDKPIHQHNPEGVSIYGNDNFMVWARFGKTKQQALQHLQAFVEEGEKYIVSTRNIERIKPAPSNIFMFESSFGDVFAPNSYEAYSGEDSNSQMRANLKRSSYTSLEGSYPVCWL
jgi:hypothetical protein